MSTDRRPPPRKHALCASCATTLSCAARQHDRPRSCATRPDGRERSRAPGPRPSAHLERILESRPTSSSDAWLDARSAASYLGLTRTALHKLTAARTIPFEQDGPG